MNSRVSHIVKISLNGILTAVFLSCAGTLTPEPLAEEQLPETVDEVEELFPISFESSRVVDPCDKVLGNNFYVSNWVAIDGFPRSVQKQTVKELITEYTYRLEDCPENEIKFEELQELTQEWQEEKEFLEDRNLQELVDIETGWREAFQPHVDALQAIDFLKKDSLTASSQLERLIFKIEFLKDRLESMKEILNESQRDLAYRLERLPYSVILLGRCRLSSADTARSLAEPLTESMLKQAVSEVLGHKVDKIVELGETGNLRKLVVRKNIGRARVADSYDFVMVRSAVQYDLFLIQRIEVLPFTETGRKRDGALRKTDSTSQCDGEEILVLDSSSVFSGLTDEYSQSSNSFPVQNEFPEQAISFMESQLKIVTRSNMSVRKRVRELMSMHNEDNADSYSEMGMTDTHIEELTSMKNRIETEIGRIHDDLEKLYLEEKRLRQERQVAYERYEEVFNSYTSYVTSLERGQLLRDKSPDDVMFELAENAFDVIERLKTKGKKTTYRYAEYDMEGSVFPLSRLTRENMDMTPRFKRFRIQSLAVVRGPIPYVIMNIAFEVRWEPGIVFEISDKTFLHDVRHEREWRLYATSPVSVLQARSVQTEGSWRVPSKEELYEFFWSYRTYLTQKDRDIFKEISWEFEDGYDFATSEIYSDEYGNSRIVALTANPSKRSDLYDEDPVYVLLVRDLKMNQAMFNASQHRFD